jgi:hypothetical protein
MTRTPKANPFVSNLEDLVATLDYLQTLARKRIASRQIETERGGTRASRTSRRSARSCWAALPAYTLQPLRVMLHQADPTVMVVGAPHDMQEDSTVTFGTLRKAWLRPSAS